MPEGDTIHRTATSLRAWIGGRVVTNATSQFPGIDLQRVIGRRIHTVEARGKHLVITFTATGATANETDETPTLALHTHMRMTGSWHVYESGARWQRPRREARLVLVTGERTAVCFNVPIASLDNEDRVRANELTALGPDLLQPFGPDVADEVERRLRSLRPRTIGEALLDQRVASGVGNVYRCEALFLAGLDPHVSTDRLPEDVTRALFADAARLLRANADRPFARDTGNGPGRPWVYSRTGRPCRRCAAPIRSALLGDPVRRAYWCPTCQLLPR